MTNGDYHVYLFEVLSKKGKTYFYTGYTSKDVEERVKEHLAMLRSRNTRRFVSRFASFKFRYSETYTDKKTAMDREREIKRKGSKYRQGLIRGFEEAKLRYELPK